MFEFVLRCLSGLIPHSSSPSDSLSGKDVLNAIWALLKTAAASGMLYSALTWLATLAGGIPNPILAFLAVGIIKLLADLSRQYLSGAHQ